MLMMLTVMISLDNNRERFVGSFLVPLQGERRMGEDPSNGHLILLIMVRVDICHIKDWRIRLTSRLMVCGNWY